MENKYYHDTNIGNRTLSYDEILETFKNKEPKCIEVCIKEKYNFNKAIINILKTKRKVYIH